MALDTAAVGTRSGCGGWWRAHGERPRRPRQARRAGVPGAGHYNLRAEKKGLATPGGGTFKLTEQQRAWSKASRKIGARIVGVKGAGAAAGAGVAGLGAAGIYEVGSTRHQGPQEEEAMISAFGVDHGDYEEIEKFGFGAGITRIGEKLASGAGKLGSHLSGAGAANSGRSSGHGQGPHVRDEGH